MTLQPIDGFNGVLAGIEDLDVQVLTRGKAGIAHSGYLLTGFHGLSGTDIDTVGVHMAVAGIKHLAVKHVLDFNQPAGSSHAGFLNNAICYGINRSVARRGKISTFVHYAGTEDGIHTPL